MRSHLRPRPKIIKTSFDFQSKVFARALIPVRIWLGTPYRSRWADLAARFVHNLFNNQGLLEARSPCQWTFALLGSCWARLKHFSNRKHFQRGRRFAFNQAFPAGTCKPFSFEDDLPSKSVGGDQTSTVEVARYSPRRKEEEEEEEKNSTRFNRK